MSWEWRGNDDPACATDVAPSEVATAGKSTLTEAVAAAPTSDAPASGHNTQIDATSVQRTATSRNSAMGTSLFEPGRSITTLFGTPVQRKAADTTGASLEGRTAQAVAGGGVAGPGAALPHLGQIQQSFGRHDVSGVTAHQGHAATEAARDLGAKAYAFGNAVAFGASPDLHTAAHEAAHVVQQRGGVQLKGGIDGGAGDPYERHADAVADAVVAGRSAEPLLDQMSGRGPCEAMVQRKSSGTQPPVRSGAKTNATAGADADTLPDNVKDFAVAPDGWSALVRTTWITAAPKEHLFQMLQQMQRMGAFRWANEAGLRRAAELTTLDGTRDVVRYMITLRTLAQMGLPPLSGAMVAREGEELIIALKIPGVKDDAQNGSHSLGPDDLNQVYHAVETFTKLTVKSHPRLEGLIIRDGIVEVHVTDKQAAELFGTKAWKTWKQKRNDAAKDVVGGAVEDKPTDVSSELSFSERMRVEGWIKATLNLIDSGPVTHIDRSTLNVIDEIEKNPDLKPILRHLVEQKGTKPGQVAGTFALEELLEAAKTERDRHRLGTDKLDQGETKTLDPSAKVWAIDGRIVQKGLVFTGREMPFQLELDFESWKMFRTANDIDKFSKRETHVELEWAVERIDKADTPATEKQTYDRTDAMVLKHTFKLPAGEHSGQFKVHAFMRSAHFAPKHITTVVEVKTEDARMEELRTQELGDMMGADPMMMNYTFDIGTGQKVLGPIAGSSRDTHGLAISGALPKDFQHTDPTLRAKGRQDEVELQRTLAEYLHKQLQDGNPGYADALQAAEQRIKFLEETETKLAGDESSGWQAFEVRGTYLSRNADVPSGGLELYGFYKTSVQIGHPARFEIKIRDLSNKIESDLEFTGDGEHFDDALREAFIKLAKAYPDGKIAVLAEDMVLDQVLQARPNGRSIGYELATTSAWKRVKSKVYDPVVQILTNAAAMAIMIIFPPSAAVIVPMLAIADIVSNVDDMVSKHDKGKLTLKNASIDLLQIGLDILPAARGAKVLNPAKTAIEAKGMANMRLVLFDTVQLGGQFVVMYERTKEQLVEIQEKQISVMADKYRALIDLEKQVTEHKLNASDPQLAQRRAEIEADAKAIRDTVATTWAVAVQHQATFFVGSHLVGGHEEAAAGHAANDSTTFAPKPPKAINEMVRSAPGRYRTPATDIRSIHDHYTNEHVDTTHLEYDPKTGTAHFEMTDHAGGKTRIEALVGHVASFGELHAATNKVVGKPVPKGKGIELLGKLNRGDVSALADVGLTDTAGGKLPSKTEFGIGALRDGTEVLVIGEPAAVDWSHLPGMEPRAHTHPPDATHDFRDQGFGGPNRVAVSELVAPHKDIYIPREAIFPSGADVIVMAHGNVKGHVVVTEFVLRDGIVMKAPAGDNGPRLIFTIVHAEHAGSMPDGRNVYKAHIVGESGAGKPPIDHDVWVVADNTDTSGNLFMEKPVEATLHEPGAPGKATRSQTTTPSKQPRSGAPDSAEQEHFEKGHYTGSGDLDGGGHAHENMQELNKRGYEELSADEVRHLRKQQEPYQAARKAYEQKMVLHNQWLKKRDAFIATLESGKELGKLESKNLEGSERTRLEALKARRDAAITAWEATNPGPGKPKKPKPEDFGLKPEDILSNRQYYYHEGLGTTGAETGGVASRNPIHEDGHTWFPPGWEAAPIMAALESKAPGITETPMINKNSGTVTATKRTAWLRRNSHGGYDVASPKVANPAADGYLKSSMITPADGAQRTVFPEMKQ